MEKIIAARIRSIDIEERIIYVGVKNQILKFYLQRSMFKKFGKYLGAGVYVSFQYDEKPQYVRGNKVFVIDHFIKITYNKKVNQETFYSIDVIKKGIKELVNSLDNKMYLDIEMTMQNFNQKTKFIQEVIQVGFVLEDKTGNIIAEENIYIKPKRYPNLNERTKKFLGVSQVEVDNGLEPHEFSVIFNKIIAKYKPTILVWGANDYLGLKSLHEVNKIPNKLQKDDFLDLLKLHKNYFSLKDDLGLFKALEMYDKGTKDQDQKHNALEDASVTRIIFHEFKKLIN